MRWRASLLVLVPALGGCAQIFGLDTTSKHEPDARPAADARVTDASSVRPCVGGDAQGTDQATGACYVFFTGPMTRDAARTACQGLGAGTRLASIQGTAESTLISGLIGGSEALIGGSDELAEGSYRWEDGTAVQLTRWNTGEPNNGTGVFEEDCIVVLGALGGLWDDRPCAPNPAVGAPGVYPFVCERD
jgi:Lectin C-type domain